VTLEVKPKPVALKQQDRQVANPSLPPPSPIEKRREPRYPANDPVEVSILEASSAPRFAGTILDVSRSGMRIEVATPIGKGSRLQIVLPDKAIIFGETRYCRRASDYYHVGIAIEDVYYPQSPSAKHIPDDQLSFYLVGKGLTVVEAITVKNHLMACKPCRDRLSDADAQLHPKKRPSR
jgi:hypothetical protein